VEPVAAAEEEGQQRQFVLLQEKVRKYEKEWKNAVRSLGVAEEELKAVGKMELHLDDVVKWFSRAYGCVLGVVVEKL